MNAGALFGVDPLDGLVDISTWIVAVVGALVLLLIHRALNRQPKGCASEHPARPVTDVPHSTLKEGSQ